MQTAETEKCEDDCRAARRASEQDPGQWILCDYCDRKHRSATTEDNFRSHEAKTLRDMASAAGWLGRESTASTWVVPGRADSLEVDVLEKRRLAGPAPRREGIMADITREDSAERGRMLAAELRLLTRSNREAGTALRAVAEKRGPGSSRTPAEVIGETLASTRQRETWEKTDKRKHGPTYWSSCAGLGRLLWERAVRAWIGRERL
jgi:hypothetical protein